MRIASILVAAVAMAASKPEYTPTVRTNVMVPMRDGVKLSADIYVPREGKWPVILYRTPYKN